jgi:8-oxo-dGTP pyrophosphatase MutT (NUDIX family)
MTNTKIFSVSESECKTGSGKKAVFSLVQSRSWALVLPVLETKNGKQFVMVRQWRHGAQAISVEFPGGVVELNEEIEEGVKRELREETGYSAKKWTLLGTMNPNPAFMQNTISFYLAENLFYEGEQQLDEDELVSVELHPVDDVISKMGKPPFIHALMASALSFYLRLKK